MKLVKILLGLVIILQVITITIRTQQQLVLEDKVEQLTKEYNTLKVRSERQTNSRYGGNKYEVRVNRPTWK